MKALLLVTSVILTNAVASAAIIVSWGFEGASPGTAGTIDDTTGSIASVAAASASAGVSASRASGGTIINIGPDPGGGSIDPYELGTAASGYYNVSGFLTSATDTRYVAFQFTLNSTVHSSVSQLQGIKFDFANGGGTGPRGVEVTYRIGTSGAFISLGSTDTPTNTAGRYGRFTFNLSSPAALSAGDVVEFRLLGYADAAGNSIRFDNVAVSAVPEPSSIALAALAGAGAIALCRRRR